MLLNELVWSLQTISKTAKRHEGAGVHLMLTPSKMTMMYAGQDMSWAHRYEPQGSLLSCDAFFAEHCVLHTLLQKMTGFLEARRCLRHIDALTKQGESTHLTGFYSHYVSAATAT